MTHRRFLAAAFIVAACLAVGFLQRSGADEKGPRDVTVQLKQLQDNVTKLEARIAALEKRTLYLTLPERNSSFPSQRSLPRGSQEQEFNGMKYYIVPVDKQK